MERRLYEQRYLDDTERFFLEENGDDIFITVGYSGNIDEISMRRAYSALCRRHPMLCSRIKYDGNGHLLRYSSSNEPDFIVHSGDFSLILRKFGQSPRFDGTSGEFRNNLGRAILTRDSYDSCKGYLTLGIHHALAAAAGAKELMRQLWELYTRIVEGVLLQEPAGKLPLPPSQILKMHGVPVLHQHANMTNSKSLPEIEEKWSDGFSQYIQLSEEETRLIAYSAKINRVSVGGFILGNLIATLERLKPEIEAREYTISTLVDMGKYLDPPVGALEATYLARPITIPLQGSKNPTKVGNDFDAKRRNSMKQKSEYELLTPDTLRLGSQRFEVGFNNGGIIPKFQTPDEVHIENYYLPQFMTEKSPMIRTIPFPPNRLASANFRTYHNKMTLQISVPPDEWEKFSSEFSIQMKRSGIRIVELENI